MLNECEQLWASGAAQALDARLTNHVCKPRFTLAAIAASIHAESHMINSNLIPIIEGFHLVPEACVSLSELSSN